jgi:lipoyl(octanoyl) transferase
MAEVEARLLHRFAEVFESELVEAPPAHETVSVVVTNPSRDRVLLLQRTEARGGFWQPVTGRVEAGERPDVAARRELFEETGFEATVHPIDTPHAFAWGPLAGTPRVAREAPFMATVPTTDVRLDPSEHVRFEWVGPDEAMRRVPWAGLARSVRTATRR